MPLLIANKPFVYVKQANSRLHFASAVEFSPEEAATDWVKMVFTECEQASTKFKSTGPVLTPVALMAQMFKHYLVEERTDLNPVPKKPIKFTPDTIDRIAPDFYQYVKSSPLSTLPMAERLKTDGRNIMDSILFELRKTHPDNIIDKTNRTAYALGTGFTKKNLLPLERLTPNTEEGKSDILLDILKSHVTPEVSLNKLFKLKKLIDNEKQVFTAQIANKYRPLLIAPIKHTISACSTEEDLAKLKKLVTQELSSVPFQISEAFNVQQEIFQQRRNAVQAYLYLNGQRPVLPKNIYPEDPNKPRVLFQAPEMSADDFPSNIKAKYGYKEINAILQFALFTIRSGIKIGTPFAFKDISETRKLHKKLGIQGLHQTASIKALVRNGFLQEISSGDKAYYTIAKICHSEDLLPLAESLQPLDMKRSTASLNTILTHGAPEQIIDQSGSERNFYYSLTNTPIPILEKIGRVGARGREFQIAPKLDFQKLKSSIAEYQHKMKSTNDIRLLKALIDNPLHFWPAVYQNQSLFRIAYRFQPPDDNNLQWSVQAYLQSTEDPNLLLPSKDFKAAWDKEHPLHAKYTQWASIFDRSSVIPGWYINNCVRMSKFFKLLDVPGLLRQARSIEHKIKPSDLSKVLHQASVLETMGFGIILPSGVSTNMPAPKVKLMLAPKSSADKEKSLVGLDKLLQFDWKVALGNHVISHEEFERLVAQKIPLIKVGSQWISVDQHGLETLKAFLNSDNLNINTLRRFDYSKTLPAGIDPNAIDLDLSQLYEANVIKKDWLKHLQSPKESFPKISKPGGMEPAFKFDPYQEEGYSWMWDLTKDGFGGCLAFDMGLGKTVQTLALILKHKEQKTFPKKPVLVICPLAVKKNWAENELKKFKIPLTALAFNKKMYIKQPKQYQKALGKVDMVVATYEDILRNRQFFWHNTWSGVVLDEAQKIKNDRSQTAAYIKKIQANWRMALSGTPIENNVNEAWSLMDFANPGLLGSLTEFRQQFPALTQINPDPIQYRQQINALKKIIDPFIYRRAQTDADIAPYMPERVEETIQIPLTQEQAALYEAAIRLYSEKASEGRSEKFQGLSAANSYLGLTTQLKYICNHPALVVDDKSNLGVRSHKLSFVTDKLKAILANNQKALIFTQYTTMGDLLNTYLKNTFGEKRVLYYNGEVKEADRTTLQNRLNDPNDPASIMVVSLKAGGTGLNLQGANHVFHYDEWWNPALKNQATCRAARRGQAKTVFVYDFQVPSTIEKHILSLQQQKGQLAANIITSRAEEGVPILAEATEEKVVSIDTKTLKRAVEARSLPDKFRKRKSKKSLPNSQETLPLKAESKK